MLLSRFMGSLTHSRSVCMCVCVCVGRGCLWLLLTGWSAPAVAHQCRYLRPVLSVLCCQIVWCSRCVPGYVRVSLFLFFVSFGFRSSSLRIFQMFPGDTRLPNCVPALPRVTVILHMLHLTLAFCLAWTLSNKLLYFTFATEFSFVIVTERSDHTMDSANALDLWDYLSNNNACMDRQEEQMLATGRAVQALVAQVSELTTQFQQLRPPTTPPPPPVPPTSTNTGHQHEPHLPTPEAYGGEPNLCRAFLSKCSLFFSLQPLTFLLKSLR